MQETQRFHNVGAQAHARRTNLIPVLCVSALGLGRGIEVSLLLDLLLRQLVQGLRVCARSACMCALLSFTKTRPFRKGSSYNFMDAMEDRQRRDD
jgi:hypothetical protein